MNKLRKCILFIGGGIETTPGVKYAKSIGLKVIVSDLNPLAPCMEFADYKIIQDIYDIEQSYKSAKKIHDTIQKIDGVICMASDVPLTVSYIASKLALPGIPVNSAKIVSDKVLMKSVFNEHKLPVPMFDEIFSIEDLRKKLNSYQFPIVIKPVDSRGARGVQKINKIADIDQAFKIAKSYSPTNRVMIEEYLEGPQISTESLVVKKKVHTIGFSDRNYEFLEKYSPYIIENGGDLPSFLNIESQNSIKDTLSKTATALGIENGVIKGDMVFSSGKPYIIEVAARLSGGYFCSHEIPLNTGVDFVAQAIKIALGEEISSDDLRIKSNTGVSQRYFFPKPGKILNISVPDWVYRNPHVCLFELRCKVGDIVSNITHHPSRAGLVICSGKNNKDARQLAKEVVDSVKIETKIET